ncbi:MAG: hypothetical protein A3H42_03415 [Deltaproteobacteria bacterium RIFCSPLOWO2_02_FULL_46_8]|nr:MAG: hypothetical protein A3H42_03415 [Deltaproteobacteria bacterium RIFCSPLOWO2_02_FULL_46_8]
MPKPQKGPVKIYSFISMSYDFCDCHKEIFFDKISQNENGCQKIDIHPFPTVKIPGKRPLFCLDRCFVCD